jgi:hypothetical protein
MTQYGDEAAHDWADPLTCDPIRHWMLETAADLDSAADCFEMPDEELLGLTILDKPHLTGAGSIVGMRV